MASDESHNLSGGLSVSLVSRDSQPCLPFCSENVLNKVWRRNPDEGKQMLGEAGALGMGVGSLGLARRMLEHRMEPF